MVSPPLTEIPDAPADVETLTVSHLKALLYWRCQPLGGKKVVLVQRLREELDGSMLVTMNRRRQLHTWRLVFWAVFRDIDRYGDDGFGNKPVGMCRVEYWLAHMNPTYYSADGDQALDPQKH